MDISLQDLGAFTMYVAFIAVAGLFMKAVGQIPSVFVMAVSAFVAIVLLVVTYEALLVEFFDNERDGDSLYVVLVYAGIVWQKRQQKLD